VQQLFPQITKMRSLLTDPEITSIRLVTNPEKMVIKQTQRTFTYLNLYGYSTDLVICNRLIPAQVTDHYFDYWKTNQEQYSKEIEERFAPLPVLTLPLLEQEVVGLTMLNRTAKELYGDRNPTEVFYYGKAHNFDKEDGQYVLSFDFPYTKKEEISLVRNSDELIIQVGKYRRNIILPRSIANLPIKGAKMEDKKLVIRFTAGDSSRKKRTS
ncbi:MAG: ArsA-related P-loop ATPase, partial [Dehalococcoidales bacterium]|nr:ArsA-related P-loop ATPase [Dehalococcoidales bacterium]